MPGELADLTVESLVRLDELEGYAGRSITLFQRSMPPWQSTM